MNELSQFPLQSWDYLAIAAFFIGLSAVGWWTGRNERANAEQYFLAGKQLPWYVVGGSFVASNISSEHFIGMVGSACVYGICVAMYEWMNVFSFSFLIWLFIPFLLASRVFTIPEFLERRFGPALRQIFALMTILTNIISFLAAVLYAGGVALHDLFAWDLWFAITALGVVAGMWAIYGGLSSVAWTDLFSIAVMLAGGTVVTILGLQALSGESHSIVDGFRVMIERNQAHSGPWAQAVAHNLPHLAGTSDYNRLSVIQPSTHPVVPVSSLLFVVLSVSIWYNVLNQFMVQRVLGAKDSYHARMGIVFAGFMKVFLPVIVVLPGLILFAMHPDILLQPWQDVKTSADHGYIRLLRSLVPAGLRGLFLAALFAAIQSTVNAVLNSTATVFTLDVYKRLLHPRASDRQLVWVGMGATAVTLALAIVLAGFIDRIKGSVFEYIQTMNAFFAPPFAAVFLLGILWRRINSAGATAAVVFGFAFGIGMKIYIECAANHPAWIEPYANQAGLSWCACVAVAVLISLATAPPRPQQVTDQLAINWRKLNIFDNLGRHWYTSVVTWWALFALAITVLMLVFSGLVFPLSAAS